MHKLNKMLIVALAAMSFASAKHRLLFQEASRKQ